MIRHPHIEKAGLVWQDHAPFAFKAYTEEHHHYRSVNKYVLRSLFASVLLVQEPNMFLDRGGYVVTRNCFDELRVFDTLDTAKTYVESIYALEKLD